MIRFLQMAVGYALSAAGLAAGAAGAWYVHAGANPPPGGGSLGHVGMVIAGAILLGLAAVLGAVGWLLLSKMDRPPENRV